MEEVLEYVEPGKRYVSRISGGGVAARVETTIEPSASRTELTVFWSGTSKSILAKLFFPFLRGMMIRRARSDLETFKDLVETYGVHFPEKSPATETSV
jgi:carbon monoxide dehydrogenase subunit G